MSDLTEKQLNSLEERRFAESIQVDENTKLEDLETPDQLEERKIKPKATPKKKRTSKKVTKKGLAGVPNNMRELHPDAEANPQLQFNILDRIVTLIEREIEALINESDNLELFIQYYPLFITDECYQRIRECVYLAGKARFEREYFIQQRDAVNNVLNPEPQEESKKGFFKRLFS